MSDGWALELLTSDLRDICSGTSAPSRPLYSSFVRSWSRDKAVPTSTADFWRGYLDGAGHAAWPPHRSETRDQGFETSRAASRHWNGSLSKLASQHGVTPAIASRIAVALAVSQASASRDVVFGVVRSGRDVDVDGAEEIAGCCVSALPNRIVLLDSSRPILEILKEEAQSDKDVRAHQKLTLADIAQIAKLPDRRDLFRILLTYQSLAEREEISPLPICQPPQWIQMPSNYALSFEVTPLADDALELSAFFDGRALSALEVDDVLKSVSEHLTSMCDDPSTTVGILLGIGGGTQNGHAPAHAPTLNGYRTKPNSAPLLSSTPDALLVAKIRPLWQSTLRLNIEHVPDDVAFVDLGGDSVSCPVSCAMVRYSSSATFDRSP